MGTEGVTEGTARTTAYAGFWRRFAAYLLDSLILSIVLVPLTLAGPPEQQAALSPVTTGIAWLYFALMESSSRQATVGKMALGIVVTDMEGNRIGFGRATGRYFAKFISALILLIGFIMAGFTEKKQALHDIIVNTLVVRR